MNKEQAKDQLLQLYENQIQDLTMMSKIELGDDVIEEIMRLKMIINSQDMPPEYNELISENFWNLVGDDEPKTVIKPTPPPAKMIREGEDPIPPRK
jgi:hypothetical protein